MNSSQTDSDGNSNNNYATDLVVKQTRKRSATPTPQPKLKSKVTKVNSRSTKQVREDFNSEEELDYEDQPTESVEIIEEDGNVVDMTVSQNQTSDNSSSESDGEETNLEEVEVSINSVNTDNSEDEEAAPPELIRKVVKKKRRESLQAKLDDVSSTLKVMQEMMIKKGFFHDEEQDKRSRKTDRQKKKKQDKHASGKSISNTSNAQCFSQSETTIYKEALVPEGNNSVLQPPEDQESDKIEVVDKEISFHIKRKDSTSSDDQIDTSDKLLDVDKFIADCQEDARRRSRDRDGERSSDNMNAHHRRTSQTDQAIKEAEAAKARMMATPGKYPLEIHEIDNFRQHANIVDESYLVIGNQIDDGLRRKIVNHEYVDFAKLLSTDRLTNEEDTRMELVSRGGSTYFVPVSDQESSGSVSNFGRWEQAFRAFSNVYIQAYPSRATELIQYNHLIYTASLLFTWDNVYRYDKEFRMHLSNFPHHNWGVILQQAWSIYLKDRIVKHNEDRTGNGGKRKEICKRFNKGKCTSGYRCSYDHRCLNCGKFGHGAHICRNKKVGEQMATVTQTLPSQPRVSPGTSTQPTNHGSANRTK